MSLRTKINPILPDREEGISGSADPHPDGRAWRKACGVCALRTSDPQEIGGQHQDKIARGTDETFFYCLHRDDDGKHRICACYAAIHGL